MRRLQTSVAMLATLSVILTVAVGAVHAQTFSVLYNFGSKAADGSSPEYSGVLAQGRDGNLYGTTPAGGASSNGAVFKITPAGTETVIYSFDQTHGSDPLGGLTLGTDGNLYGTAYASGTSCCGTVFKITPAGALAVLYNFTGGADGGYPYAPPVQGTDGNWYGTTNAGGTGSGTVYKLTPTGTLTTIYQFDNTHGNSPRAPLVLGADGNFYGTTLYGGANGDGEVFKITPSGSLTVLFSFDDTHGRFPTSPVIQGIDGNFYGTTQSGGTGESGVIFKMTSTGTVTVLHNVDGINDGNLPYAGLVQASDGNFYGVDGNGGASGSSGTFFKITTKGAFSVVHDFDVTHGSTPQVAPLQHTNGILYGDTSSGGTGNVSPCTTGACGVFYSENGTYPAFIKLLPYSGKVGSKIGILGQGFSTSSVVKFNGVTATVASRTGTTYLGVTVPAGASDGLVTVTTGATTLTSLRKFVVHNSWGAGAAMPTARAGGAAGVINGKVYVVSGETTGAIVGNNEIYNPATNTWTTGAAIPTPRYVPASAVVGGILYVMGGIKDSSQSPQAVVEAYNPVTNTWSTKSPMPIAVDSANAVVQNNLIYVVGGFASGARSALVQRYNPATDTWSTVASLSTAK